LNQVSLVTYPKINVTTTNTYNAAGALLRSRTQQGQRPYYDEAFSYSRGGMITDKFFTQDGESRHETYGYDQAARLMSSFERAWPGSPMFGVAADQTMYQYDAAGNRTEVFRETRVNNAYLPPQSHYYGHTPGTNQLTRVSDVSIVNGVTAGNPTFDDVLTYDPDGSMISRTKNRVEGGFASQSIEDYTYDAFNLVRGYRVRRTSIPVDGLSACRPDASTSPADVWSYRFGPLQEREQKRQLVSSADTTLAWVYTLVGADGRQLATYNGLQGSMCGRNGVRLWPVEFNTYGPNNTRIITRADGTSEVVISDYLGSARVTLSTTAEPLQSSSYHPYGTERTSTGSGARTSYIGREHDKETDLGFYGVRLYEPEYGRFLSTDPLWGEFPQTSTYVYADNEPITKKDPSGAIWETIWDVANVVVDAGRVAYHVVKGNTEAAKEAAVDLAFDALATVVPGVPAGLNKLRHADEAVDAAKAADKVVDASKAGKKTTEGAEQVGKGSKTSIHVTRDGVALPPGQKHQIPKGYVENPNRNGSYGVIVNGKFVEKLRIDPATQPGKKGPSYSHYHLDGKSTHYSPRPGSKDPGFTPKPPENK
jgi:RHS repeat-associated protein